MPASYESIPGFSAPKKRKLVEYSGIENFDSIFHDVSKLKNKTSSKDRRMATYDKYDDMNNFSHDDMCLKKRSIRRKLKSRKSKHIREGRTWNVQSMFICDGKNASTAKNIFSSSSTTSFTTLPCVDILSEVKAQGY